MATLMLKTLNLLLPALIPSWNFFDVIAPSPRIEYVVLSGPTDKNDDWQTFRPKPDHLSPLTMLGRMFWNPRWNESLFLVSCTERLTQDITPEHCEREILSRIRAELKSTDEVRDRDWFQFRLVFVELQDNTLTREVIYVSAPEPVHNA